MCDDCRCEEFLNDDDREDAMNDAELQYWLAVDEGNLQRETELALQHEYCEPLDNETPW